MTVGKDSCCKSGLLGMDRIRLCKTAYYRFVQAEVENLPHGAQVPALNRSLGGSCYIVEVMRIPRPNLQMIISTS
ncbi:hypothetical protein KC19_2G145500 [Ceratodon purpureus]|uniref:Uncharacterized protein n=1 Tax=Ceratodon purpureus TaxID=3225 RepID=A0A8T0IWW8_CERPU|nr:hypothetical protein KC19_2G145500 [Ceratodon purpureus]